MFPCNNFEMILIFSTENESCGINKYVFYSIPIQFFILLISLIFNTIKFFNIIFAKIYYRI